MGGVSGQIGQSLVNSGLGLGGKAPSQPSTAQPVAGYTPAQTQPTYSPAFNSNQNVQFSPAVQQAAQQHVMYQQQMNPYFSQSAPGYTPQQQGLQQLLGNMMSRYQQPQGLPQQQMAPQQMMPQYGKFNTTVNPLAYRPTMQPAEQSLNRVAKSVILQQKEAAEAEAARLRAEAEARANDNSGYNPYYGGGG